MRMCNHCACNTDTGFLIRGIFYCYSCYKIIQNFSIDYEYEEV